MARDEGLAVEIVDEIVASPKVAERRRFPGSPTIRVEGRDLQPGVAALGDYGLG